MNEDARGPGWDKQVVNRIAREAYGGLAEMFAAHGWDAGDHSVSQVAPTRIVGTYGSVAAFEKAHAQGRELNALLDPTAAIRSDPPDVWLTSFYGFTPELWGVLPFTLPGDRKHVLEHSRPGALFVIYATKDRPKDIAGKVLGVYQISHHVGPAEGFADPELWQKVQSEQPDQYLFGIECVRAWRVPTELRPKVEAIAPETYSADWAQIIGRRGVPLTSLEAKRLLDLPLIEVPVFGRSGSFDLLPAPGKEALKPSRPGPVSQSPYLSREAEGPKHLYILRLTGVIDPFVEEPLAGREIVKVGFSVSPECRARAFNAAMPGDRFRWEIRRSTFAEGRAPYPASGFALAGEQVMISHLKVQGRSLGGEFFLAAPDVIEAAWKAGKTAADEHST
jgi:hypothetical protein